jgi:hypothetical protein
MRSLPVLLVLGLLSFAAGDAAAKSIFVPIAGTTAIITIDNLHVSDSLVINGQVPTFGSSLSHTVVFTAPASILRGTITWNILNKARLVGVNVDLLDSTGATVVASDSFQGTVASRVAVSTLDASGLTRGAVYRIRLTGTQITTANYSIVLEFGSPP